MVFTNFELLVRLVIAASLGGIIGYEREMKGRDAGVRTHTLVSLGAAIITLIQLEATQWVIEFARDNTDLAPIVTTDITRLTAQIVNGIGFLGAGTIIVSKRSVSGLTTAASIWAVASLGIAAGMGYYFMAISSTVIMLIVLRFVKSFFRIERTKQLEIRYENREDTLHYLEKHFNEHHIKVVSTDHSITYQDDGSSICRDRYTLHLPPKFNMMHFIAELGESKNIFEINTLKTRVDD